MKPYYEKNNIVLYHGDCREVLPALADGSIDFIFTDPPYGHNNNDGDLIQAFQRPGNGQRGYIRGDGRAIENDGAEETSALVKWSFKEWSRLLNPDSAVCCCCGGGGPDPQFARWSLWLDKVLTFKQMIVWDKGKMGMGWHYRRSYETVLVAHKGPKCRWYDTTNRIENVIRTIRKIIPQAHHHPTPKPVQLAQFFMRLHTLPGHTVLDPFVGGGITLVAALRLGRPAIGVELDERWCEMTARRLDGRTTKIPRSPAARGFGL